MSYVLRAALAALVVVICCKHARAQSSSADRAQSVLGAVFDDDVLRDLPLGDNVYSLNDRTATADGLDLVIATPGEMTSLRKSLPAEFRSSVFVEAPIDDGMVVVRSFVPDDSFRPGVSAFLGGLTCLSRPAEAEAQ